MKKYALIKNGIVHSTFYSDKPKSDFPDIEPYLLEVSESVQCNMKLENGEFFELIDDDNDGETPSVWQQIIGWFQ